MKANLTFDNSDVLSYLKNNLVKDYTEGRMILQVPMKNPAPAPQAS